MSDVLPGKAPGESAVEMVELILPNDANPMGNCLGGRVMYLIDVAAFMAASRHSSRTVVTASMDSLDFHQPILVGEAVILQARVNYAARTSMEVEVQVYAENLIRGERRHTCTAYLTFVAVDQVGHPAQVPQIIPGTEAEKTCSEAALGRRAERLARRERAKG